VVGLIDELRKEEINVIRSPCESGQKFVAVTVGEPGGMIVIEVLSEIEARTARWSSIEKAC